MCPECGTAIDDILPHYLTEHQGFPVPREIVLWAISKDPQRCSECYRSFTNMFEHCQTFHVPSVSLTIGGTDIEIEREESGRFICPWCTEPYFMANEFEVRSTSGQGVTI